MSKIARFVKNIEAMAAQKPDPTAVEAKTEADHHHKVTRLRRINEEINDIEESIDTDSSAEGVIRDRLAARQTTITENKHKRDEIDRIILQDQEAMEQDKKTMEKSQDLRRQQSAKRMKVLIGLQTAVFIEVKQAERTLHAELTQRIEGYEMNDVPDADEAAPLDDLEDYDSDASDVEPAMKLPPIQATDDGLTAAPNARVLAGFFARKRPAEVTMEKTKKKVVKEAPRKPKPKTGSVDLWEEA